MPVEGLPYVLETSLNAIINEYKLSSWRIQSGEEFTQIILRFPMVGGSQGEVEYRRAPPSRISRDRKRAEDRQLNSNQYMIPSHEIGTQSEEICSRITAEVQTDQIDLSETMLILL